MRIHHTAYIIVETDNSLKIRRKRSLIKDAFSYITNAEIHFELYWLKALEVLERDFELYEKFSVISNINTLHNP